ncbi:MAG: hypothetical protein GY842_09495 [bacterium]|nr:hypothetical protein [bacterium]
MRLSSDVGATPTSYAVIVDLADGRISAISCPGDAQDTLACVDEGLRISEPSEQLTVTVKARGFAFFTQQFELGSLPVEDGDAVAAISLDALAPFEQTEDYATGFDSDDGLVAYRSLAHEADTDLGPASVVKFYVDDIASEPRVYFQNTVKHKLHYGFVRNVLGNSLTSAEFWEATYVGLERSAMAGTVIMYDAVRADSQALDQEIAAPLCVTFFPSDNLTPAQAATAHRLIEERIGFAPLIGGQGPVVYLPAGEDQEAALSQETALFARRGALWIVHRELYGNVTQQILNPGLAFGTLRYLTPEALKNAVVSFKDILVLSRLPNSLPIVGGTITEELQTPLAHVNVAARARGTPNMALLDAAADQRIAPFIGKLVRFEVKSGAFTLEETTLDQARAYWESQQKDPVYPEFDLERDGLPSFEEIGFSDSVSVGAKAANLADLSNLLQQTAPHGFAIPFYYYDQFMREGQVTEALCAEASQDCELEGRTAEICNRAEALCIGGGDTPENFWIFAERLIDRGEFESDTELREAVLDSLRYIMRHTEVTPDFADALNSRVDELFGSDKVRLRSSTNAEDLEDFSGAGLYKSVSAYSSGDFKLASDQVRKVWASVWSFGAFEERAFWNIDHLSVQMGVAVNQAFPDEAANGVLITQNIADPTVAGMYVNVQRGEVPVTNPENGAIPEIFSIIPGADSWSVQVARLRYSSLSPDEPILRDAEVEQLYKASRIVQHHFAPLYGENPNTMILDLEFKFHGPERALFIKQARPYLNAF